MRRGKYQAPRRKLPVTFWIILLVAVIGTSIGGTRAYLSHSAGSVTTTFVQNADPKITVNTNYSITVEANYDVYLRAAVVPSWKNGNNIIAALPSSFTIQAGQDWFLHSDGFYYYVKPIKTGETSSICTVSGENPSNYTLSVDIAVQAIQAVGTIDNGDTKAVVAAWGVDPRTLEKKETN